MSELIRDERSRLKGQVIENGNASFMRDEKGKLKGQYIKSADKTFSKGRYFGPGDQLLRTLDKSEYGLLHFAETPVSIARHQTPEVVYNSRLT